MADEVDPAAEPPTLAVESSTLPTSQTEALQTAAMRGSWWTAVQAVIGLPVAFVANLVVARSLGPHSYGVLASYTVVYGLVVTVLNAGVSDATVQWGAAAYARQDRPGLIDLCRRCAGFHIFVEAPLAAMVPFVLLRGSSVATQLLAAVAGGLTMLLGTAAVVLTSMSMNAPLAKQALFVGLSVQLAVVTAAVNTHAAAPVFAWRLGLSVLSSVGAVALAPSDIRRAAFKPLPPIHWPSGFARYSSRTLVAGLVTTLVFSRCEILVLDAYGAPAAAGAFALAAGLASQITAPIDAMLGPLIPAAASLVEIDRGRASTATLRGLRLSALITAPLAVFAIPAVSVLAPTLYGGRFQSTGALFIALGAVSCLQSVLHPVSAFVGALRRPMVVLAFSSGALALDLALVGSLAPVFGATGAVVGNSVGQVASLVASVWMLRRYLALPLRPTIGALAPFFGVLTVVVLACAGGVIAEHAGVAVPIVLIVTILVAAVGSLLAARAMGGLVEEADMRPVLAGFPRAGRRLDEAIHRLRLARGL